MKILHTADWHLGKRLERFDRLTEQREAMAEICAIADQEDVDAVLIAGDLFDNYNPTNEATDLFFKTIRKLTADGRRAVVAIAGNHDSPDRIASPDPLARECGIILAGFPDSKLEPFELETGLKVLQSDAGFVELKLPRHDFPLRLLLTPYANEQRIKKELAIANPDASLRELLQNFWQDLSEKYCDEKGFNLLMAHLMMMPEGSQAPDQGDDEEKRIQMGPASMIYTQNLPQGLDYVALGHIHQFMQMSGGPCPVVYSSSPLAYAFPKGTRNGKAGGKHVVIIEGGPGKELSLRSIPLQSGLALYRKQFADTDSALKWLAENQDCFVELYLETESYISATDRRAIMEAHPRVVGPIPLPRRKEGEESAPAFATELQKSREELFKDYFLKEKQVEASQEIMDLFLEVIGKEVEA
jgi:exonuclease SbcD